MSTARLPVPESVILNGHSATLGKTGAGKSSALRDIVEYLLDKKKRVVVVDPKGDWWGLKASADGRGAGYPVILFGNFKNPDATDVPIDERSGKHLAELVVAGNRPCVIGFRGWMPAQLVRFWIEFASTLFNTNHGELYVVIDEVHNFAPKGKVMDPDSGKSLHWTNRILGEGRGIGITFMVASQRPQKVHNDTLDGCETLIAMRVTHPRSRESTEEWINAKGDKALAKEVLSSLADLKRGEAWVWSPENQFGPKRVQFPMFKTFDSFAPPQLQNKVSQAGWSEVDLDAVKEKLASVIAEAKANDPKELRAEVQRLKLELTKKPSAAVSLPAKVVPQAKADTKVLERLREGVAECMRVIAKITAFGFEQAAIDPQQVELAVRKSVDEIRRVLQVKAETKAKEIAQLKKDITAAAKRLESLMNEKLNLQIDVVRADPPFVLAAGKLPRGRKQTGPREEPVQPSDGVSGPEQRILDSIAWMNSIGVEKPGNAAIAFLSNYSPTSGGYKNPRSVLRTKGLVNYESEGRIVLTDAGRQLANTPSEALSTKALQDRVLGQLPGPERKLLSLLLKNGAMSNEELSEASNYSITSGGYKNPRSRLRSLGLVEYDSGKVVPSDFLFRGD